MAASGEDVKPLGPWPKGMNNRLPEYALAGDQLRVGINVDVDNTGVIFRRKGATQVYSGDVHSIFGAHGRLYFYEDGSLWAGIDSPVEIATGLSNRPISYALYNNTVYWSNGAQSGRIVDGSPPENLPWGLDQPSAPVLAAVGGSLCAGRYQVTALFVGPDGEEGGAPSPSVIEVVDGQGILVLLPQPTDGYSTDIRVYTSETNGADLYAYGTYAVGTPTVTIVGTTNLGKPIVTERFDRMPVGDIVSVLDGRTYVASGKQVTYSTAFYPHIHDPGTDFILFPEDVSVLLACVDGHFIVADRTYWLSSSNPTEAALRVLSEDKAVPGTGLRIPNDMRVAWFGDHGWVVGSPGGNIDTPMDANVAVDRYQRGAGLFREVRGIRQLVSSLQRQTMVSRFVATDFADAEIVRAVK